MGPRSILERWGRRPRPSRELASALADLDRLGLARPELAAAAGGLAGLLREAFLVPDRSTPEPDDVEAMAAGWPAGMPSFRSRPPRLDGKALTARCRGMADALAEGNPAARALSDAIRGRRVDVPAWADLVFTAEPAEVDRRSEAAGVDPVLMASILRLALLPSLATFSSALARVRPEGAWDRGDCPDCGSRPLLAESRGLEQRIFLRCGLCAAGWPGERLGCPSCGETDARSLRFSYVEGEQGRHRLSHCDACRYDWRVVSTLSALTPPGLLVADLATVHLDWLAEQGRTA